MRGWIRRRLLALIPRQWHRSARLERKLLTVLSNRIQAGPFAGVQYVDRSYGSAYWPKLLGSYERELRGTIEGYVRDGPSTILVVGAAEGYYAVGLAVRVPTARVVAWEPNSEAREALAELARMNGVEGRIEVRGICDICELARNLEAGGPILLIVDVDGGEAVLLDPAVVPALRRVDILVETHDCLVPGVTTLLRERFERSHRVEFIEAACRGAGDLPPLALPRAFEGALVQLLAENRPPGNDWLVMSPSGSQ